MSSTPYIKELLDFAIEMAESLSERIPKSESLQRDCKNLAASLRTWRNNLPSEMDFLLRPTGSKSLYHEILVLLSELLCILCTPPSQTLTHRTTKDRHSSKVTQVNSFGPLTNKATRLPSPPSPAPTTRSRKSRVRRPHSRSPWTILAYGRNRGKVTRPSAFYSIRRRGVTRASISRRGR